MEDLMKYAGATRPRVISHLKHLYSVWNVDLRITEDKKYFIVGHKSDKLVGAKSNGTKIIDTVPTDKKADKPAKKDTAGKKAA